MNPSPCSFFFAVSTSVVLVLGNVACDGSGPEKNPVPETVPTVAPPERQEPPEPPEEGKTPEPPTTPQNSEVNMEALLDPSKCNETAPGVFKVRFETSKGDFVLEVNREWAPNGADRFYNLVKNGFYNEVRFFRVIKGFMAQFGIHGDPAVSAKWKKATIQDDPVVKSNERGYVTFATAGPNTRTTQVFINFKDNVMLDRQGFSPFANVVEGMDVVDALFGGYGESVPRGRGPSQDLIQRKGNEYLERSFAQLDYIKQTVLLP